jgi:hypothetical protein
MRTTTGQNYLRWTADNNRKGPGIAAGVALGLIASADDSAGGPATDRRKGSPSLD